MVNVLCYHSSNYHIFSKKFDSIYVKRLVTRTECWRTWLREGKQQQKLPNKEIHFYQTLWPMEFPSHAHSVQFLTVSRKHDFNLFPPLKCRNIAWGQDESSSPVQATYNELWCYRNHVLYYLKKSCIFAKNFILASFLWSHKCTVSDVLYCKKIIRYVNEKSLN